MNKQPEKHGRDVNRTTTKTTTPSLTRTLVYGTGHMTVDVITPLYFHLGQSGLVHNIYPVTCTANRVF